MCDRIVQSGKEVTLWQTLTVILRGATSGYESPYTEAVFSGTEPVESRNHWVEREHAEEVIIPYVSRFGGTDETTGKQYSEDTPPSTALEGLLLPSAAGEDLSTAQGADARRYARSGGTPGQ